MEQNPLSADWSATVKLFKGEELYSVELIAGDQELLIQKSINWLADQLGSMYAVAAQAYQTESEFLHITFKNVPNMKTLITIEAFLSSLPAVNNSTIYEINEYGVEFRIKLLGESLDVFNALSLDDRIDKIKVSFGETLPVQNYFSWKGRTR
jgi:hypothetical protein